MLSKRLVVIIQSSLSHVWLFATPWSVAHQAPLSMGFPRQEYWSELSCPPPGDLPNLRIKLGSPALAGGFSTTEPPGSPVMKPFLMNSPFFFLHLLFMSQIRPYCLVLISQNSALYIIVFFIQSMTVNLSPQLVFKCLNNRILFLNLLWYSTTSSMFLGT